MKYMLALYGDSSTWGTQSDEEFTLEQKAFAAFEREAAEAGVLVGKEALEPEGHTLSVQDGAPAVTDAPPTKPEQRLGCFYVLDCNDLDDVTEWATKIPLVGDGGFHSIEIRAVMA